MLWTILTLWQETVNCLLSKHSENESAWKTEAFMSCSHFILVYHFWFMGCWLKEEFNSFLTIVTFQTEMQLVFHSTEKGEFSYFSYGVMDYFCGVFWSVTEVATAVVQKSFFKILLLCSVEKQHMGLEWHALNVVVANSADLHVLALFVKTVNLY